MIVGLTLKEHKTNEWKSNEIMAQYITRKNTYLEVELGTKNSNKYRTRPNSENKERLEKKEEKNFNY